MAIVGRLAGAILAETMGRYFLIGDVKEPCDFRAHGFSDPGDRDLKIQPYVELHKLNSEGSFDWRPQILAMDIEGEALAAKLAGQFMIKRNGSISERLWRLVTESSPLIAGAEREVTDARWLGSTPDDIWDIVRDSVLRC